MAIGCPLSERGQNQVFEGLAAAGFLGLGVSGGQGEPEQVFAQIVTDNYFSLLGPRAQADQSVRSTVIGASVAACEAGTRQARRLDRKAFTPSVW